MKGGNYGESESQLGESGEVRGAQEGIVAEKRSARLVWLEE